MPTALIIGSGPAAAGAALALGRRADVTVTVLDLGLQLETDRQRAVRELSLTAPAAWDDRTVQLVSTQPVDAGTRGLPQKRSYGSDFPFRDVGQLAPISTGGTVNRQLVSAAYGGFSNVWGTQIMPFTPGTFGSWPVSHVEMEPHYRAILDHLPFAAEEDDLAAMFPLLGSPSPLPEVSPRTSRVLASYNRKRKQLNQLGVTIGKARLAFESSKCLRCGLCMTGCPYGLVYSAAHTFDDLRQSGKVRYHGGLQALEVGEEAGQPFVKAREIASGRIQRFEADRVFVACGAVGTTQLVLNSLRLFGLESTLGESVQFTLPFVSRLATPDPRGEESFTLNQFNMVIALDDAGLELSQLHFYSYNPAFLEALPAVLRPSAAEPVTTQVLRRIGVALGYLPSWASPRLRVRAHPSPRADELPRLEITRDKPNWGSNAMLRKVLWRVVRSAPHLDLYPVLPMLRMAPGGKSYHWGGSFPHSLSPTTAVSSDRMGRVGPWTRVHLVDASVFPNVPATTFTLTIMANSHRIATESFDTPS